MNKKLFVVYALVLCLIVCISCGAQDQETDNVENNLKAINKGIDKFSKLKNGILKTTSFMDSENHAVKDFVSMGTTGTAITTFILKRKGYDYIEKMESLNTETGEYQYNATKQVGGKLFNAFSSDESEKKLKIYDWYEVSGNKQDYYEPNGILRMMAEHYKILGDVKYIADITKEQEGTLTKYTLISNDAYAKYLKEIAHRPEENYNVIVQKEIYWIDKNGLLVKHQSFGEAEITFEGIVDIYTSDTIIELSRYNDKKLKEITEELIN